VTTPPDNRSPLAEAMEWVSRITAVAFIMVLPGIGGQWLDRWLGTKFIGLVGFVLGVTSGIAYLVAMTRPPQSLGSVTKAGESEKDSSGE
jgi:hypothetical protein